MAGIDQDLFGSLDNAGADNEEGVTGDYIHIRNQQRNGTGTKCFSSLLSG